MASPSLRSCLLCLFLTTAAANADTFTFDNGLALTVPSGFEVERVAGSPLIDRPVMADFDSEGRLYVAEVSGTNDDVETQLRDKPHSIVCLEDRDDDGKYDRKVVFADQLMLPEGVLCYRGSVYVSAPPVIWKLTDTDDDGVCDLREVWHDGKTLTGCANDLHGPYLGRDGWIYWCKGAFAEQTYPRPDNQPPFVSRAAHIFRKHPDGGLVEPVMTGGMDNPVEVVFSPTGERFFTTTFLQHPAAGKRDGIIHAIYGGVYGKDHDVVEGHPRTGDLMPIMTHLGPAAACGLMHVESTGLGESYQGNLFATAFNMRKITRHQLAPAGATFTTKDEDFLVANQMDFHPTDILEDGDGSLLVIDTGGWYKLCCPTSQLHKPEALGAIYRVRRANQAKVADPYGRAIAWEQLTPAQLTTLLDDNRHLVRKRAIDALALQSESSINALTTVVNDHPNPRVVQDAVWSLTRIDSHSARSAVRSALSHRNPNVRQTALHSISVRHDKDHSSPINQLILDPSPAVQRSAAEALATLGSPTNVQAILQALPEATDRVLEHSVIFALIHADPTALLANFHASENPTQTRACLIALDQSQHPGLGASAILPFLEHADTPLSDTAWAILTNHLDWADAAAPTIERLLEQASSPQRLTNLLAAWSHKTLISKALASSKPQVRHIGQEIIAKAKFKALPPAWNQPIEDLLTHSPDIALNILSKIPASDGTTLPTGIQTRLNAIITNENAVALHRLQAMALVDTLQPINIPWIIERLNPDEPANHRSTALSILTKHPVTKPHVNALCRSLATIGPMEFTTFLDLLKPHLSNPDTAALIVQSLKRNPIVANLPPASLTPLINALPDTMADEKAKLIATFQANQTEQATKLETLLSFLPKGDVVRGQRIFNSNKAACATCHQIGYLGGRLGPDLTRVGTIRSRRDLLEAIIFPSASFVRSYESVLVQMKGDQQALGILKQDNEQQITLAIGPSTEISVNQTDIISMKPATHSLMPPGLDAILTKAELGDLLAFLENTKWR